MHAKKKKKSHIDTCKQWHKQPDMCKRWCSKSNRVLTCVTLKIKTFRLIKKCHVPWRKSLKTSPTKLWHMSPIKLHHVSLIHPQTLINRSLPKAFQHTHTHTKNPTHLGRHQDSEVQKLCWNQALKPPRTLRTSTSNTKNIWREII